MKSRRSGKRNGFIRVSRVYLVLEIEIVLRHGKLALTRAISRLGDTFTKFQSGLNEYSFGSRI